MDSNRVTFSVIRSGDFLNFRETKIFTKVAKMIGNFLGYFEKTSLFCNHCCIYFLGNFWENLGYFLLQHLVTLVTLYTCRGIIILFLILWLGAENDCQKLLLKHSESSNLVKRFRSVRAPLQVTTKSWSNATD